MSRCIAITLLLPVFAASTVCSGETDERPAYLAVFTDGTRSEGRELLDWGSPDSRPRLDNTSLADAAQPLRWLEDRRLRAATAEDFATGFVEFTSGDRLPGRVVGFEPCASVELAGGRPHLLLVPLVPVDHPSATERMPIRVFPQFVRRIVWERSSGRRLAPGTLVYRDGRRARFRSARWTEAGLGVLLEDGVRQIPLVELAEVRFPRRDPWRSYYDELAVLVADGTSRLVRLETTEGLIVTSTQSRLRPITVSLGGKDCFFHPLQPAWSCDVLWMPLEKIRMRLYFAPHEVPMSRIEPAAVERRPIFSTGWPLQIDRNVQGGPLMSGDRTFGWGIGVHAPCVLAFDLPESVRAFRTRAGLDRAAGDGGCVRAAVFVNSTRSKPLYQSPHLVGCRQVVDSGIRGLAGPSKGQRALVLAADPAAADHPPGADPFDVRDTLDWLEPMLLLDPNQLQKEVLGRIEWSVAAWDGWTAATAEGKPPQLTEVWDDSDAERPRWRAEVSTAGDPLVLSGGLDVSPPRQWLMVALRQVGEGADTGRLTVRADGRPIARADVLAHHEPQRYFFSLRGCGGSSVSCEIVYEPGNENDRIEWLAATPVARPKSNHWTALGRQLAFSSDRATMTAKDDGSFLVEGDLAKYDVYTVVAESRLEQITALRLEALPDAALHNFGPGLAPDGNFVLSQIRLALGDRDAKPVAGQFVRVEMPKPPLTLAEVQVTSGGRNVACYKAASQSSTWSECEASRAIDGNPDGDFFEAKSCSHTAEASTDAAAPWWEVDLRETHPIDAVTVWNRQSFKDRLNDFTVTILDAKREAVWKRTVGEVPDPVVSLYVGREEPVPLGSALADCARENWGIFEALEDGWPEDDGPRESGWSIGEENRGKAHAAVFLPEKPIETAGRRLVVRLYFLYKNERHGLGRFRLSVTDDAKVNRPLGGDLIPPRLPEPDELPVR